MRSLYAALAASLLSGHLIAQCTPVDCLSGLPAWGGLCAQSLLDGRVGEPYTDAISFHITNACTPATVFDPSLTGVSVRITQVSSIGFSQLPAGISGATNQPAYTPPANGCGSLSGVPAEAGVFDASVDLVVNVNAWPFSLACGGFGPVPQNGNAVSFALSLTILPDPSFDAPATPLCVTDAPVQLMPTGTSGGSFSGPGVVGDTFDPAIAGVGVHEVWYIVSAQEGAAVAPAIDSAAALIEVNADCLGECQAFAGSLAADIASCLEPGGFVELVGIPGGDAVVPSGYSLAYVLTQGAGLTIMAAGPDPVFQVSETGTHAIHALVYDPLTLDPGQITWGVTTAAEVNAQLVQGGGTICGSLDLVGAQFDVVACEPPCEAFAGTLGGLDFIPCLEPGGFVELVGIPGGDAVVPNGYSVAYVLTQGLDLVILAAGPDPMFQVSETGPHAIHTLVYDPATLDPGQITWGVTTAAEVYAQLIQGGGDICASLDLTGASYIVLECAQPCDADAGTLSGGGPVCLESGEALLSASPNGDAMVPDGFVLAYGLTQGPGLVVVAAALQPEFLVSETGTFTIHPLVFDPTTLDLGAIEFGVTTGFDIAALLVQGGGSICGSLGVDGAPFQVDVCNGVPGNDKKGFTMFPNPSDGLFLLHTARAVSGRLDVLDMSGRVVRSIWVTATDQPVAIELGDVIAPGSYLVRLTQGGAHWERPLIVRP